MAHTKGGGTHVEPGDDGLGLMIVIMLIAVFLIGQFYIKPFVEEHEANPSITQQER